MDNTTVLNINLKALKKVDPYIQSIESHSSNVALYKFKSEKGEWEKTEVEGTMFVYKREAEPVYGFTIMNRLSTDNLVEPVTKEMDFQVQTPFLLYRNKHEDIYGIWFFEKKDCVNVGEKIQRLVQVVESRDEKKTTARESVGDLSLLLQNAKKKNDVQQRDPTNDADTGKNLLRLISQSENNGGSARSSRSPENNMADTTTSVKDFFAKASSSNTDLRTTPQLGHQNNGFSAFQSVPLTQSENFLGGGLPPAPYDLQHLASLGFNHLGNIQALPISQGLAMGKVPVGGFPQYMVQAPTTHTMVQNLLQNPGVHTVDKLEETQRRQQAFSPIMEGQAVSPPKARASGKLNDLESQLKQKLHIGSRQNVQQAESHAPGGMLTTTTTTNSATAALLATSAAPPGLNPHPRIPSSAVSAQQLEAGQLHQLRQQQPQQLEAEQLHQMRQQQPQQLDAEQLHQLRQQQPQQLEAEQLHQMRQQQQSNGQPTLISPQVFAKTSETILPVNGITSISNSIKPSITPLTQQQMVEAMQFLLDTDPQFTEKLHSAYILSLSRKFRIQQ